MSHFFRMKKSGDVAVRKGGYFSSGDAGGKDAGASNANPQFQPSTASHLNDIADRHANEGELHREVGEKLGWMGMEKHALAHKAIANEHGLAAGHYRAAADASMDDSRAADVASHLKNARASASSAKDKTDELNG
jgi:hypothetical protein